MIPGTIQYNTIRTRCGFVNGPPGLVGQHNLCSLDSTAAHRYPTASQRPRRERKLCRVLYSVMRSRTREPPVQAIRQLGCIVTGPPLPHDGTVHLDRAHFALSHLLGLPLPQAGTVHLDRAHLGLINFSPTSSEGPCSGVSDNVGCCTITVLRSCISARSSACG